MKMKAIPFKAEDLVRSVEEIRDHVTGKRKLALRTTQLKLITSNGSVEMHEEFNRLVG